MVTYILSRVPCTEGRGRVKETQSNSDTQYYWIGGNAPECDDIPALVPPLDHDGPAIEESNVPRARQVRIQRWLSKHKCFFSESVEEDRSNKWVLWAERLGMDADLHAVACHCTNRTSDLRENCHGGQPEER